MTFQTVLAAWPIWAPILTVVLASVATRLTPYPKAGGVVTALRVVLDVLSVLTHKDSPGTLQLPLVQRSKPPEGALEVDPPNLPPAVLLMAGLSLLAAWPAHAGEPQPLKGEIVLSRDRGQGTWRVADYRLLADATPAAVPAGAAEVRPLPPAAAEPEVSQPAPEPRPPTITEILSCTAADALTAIPSALSRCARNPTVAAPIDSRVFWTVLGSSLGNVAMTVGGILLQPYLNPDPVK